VNSTAAQLRIILVHSIPVDDLVQDLRRLHVDTMAESTEWALSPSSAITTATCLVIHPSVSPQRCEEIRNHFAQKKIRIPLIVESQDQPLNAAIDIARAARNISGGSESSKTGKRRPVSLGTNTVLVVDDDDILRRALKRTFRRLPASILEASDPEDAKKFLSEFDIDLIMSDYTFAGGPNGLEFLERCRVEYPQIPRMLLSGHDLVSNQSLPGDRSAADVIIQKPWNLDEFLSTCRTLIERASTAD
jgi:CheY-like chemotaxis protein